VVSTVVEIPTQQNEEMQKKCGKFMADWRHTAALAGNDERIFRVLTG
jgi:hypothetical protein